MKGNIVKLSLVFAILLFIPTTSSATAEKVPEWVKNNAAWWSEDQIDDQAFVKSLEFLVNEKIIKVTASNADTKKATEIPTWVKTTAAWWSDGTISEDEFFSAVEFLVNSNIISVGNNHSDTPLLSTDGEVVMIAQETEAQKANSAPIKEEWMMHPKPGDKIDYPGVAIDTTRNAIHVTYGSTIGGESNIFLKTSYDGGKTFDEPVRVNTVENKAEMPHANPAYVDMGPNGEIYVLYNVPFDGPEWVEKGFGHGYTALYITKSTDGGKTFSPAQMIDPQTGPDAPRGMLHSKTFDSMHVSEDGKVYVSWLDSRGKQNGAYIPTEVKTTWSDDGLKTFSKAVTVKTKVCQCCVTSTCTDSKGGVYVQYRNIIGNYGEPNYRDIVVSASHDGGMNWNTPELVADDGFEIDNCPHSTSTITTDSYGNLHSAWWTQGGQSPGTYYAASEDGGLTWTKPLFIEGDSEWFPATQIKIVMDSNENPVIVWTNRTVEGGAVKHTTIIDGQVTDIIELGNGDHAWSDSDGGVTALVWKANDGRILIKSWNDNA